MAEAELIAIFPFRFVRVQFGAFGFVQAILHPKIFLLFASIKIHESLIHYLVPKGYGHSECLSIEPYPTDDDPDYSDGHSIDYVRDVI